jgi:hypothetical protein
MATLEQERGKKGLHTGTGMQNVVWVDFQYNRDKIYYAPRRNIHCINDLSEHALNLFRNTLQRIERTHPPYTHTALA